MGRKKFKDGFNFEWVKSDIIFGHNEAKNSADKNVKETLKRVKENVILVTSEKHGMQIKKMLRLTFGTTGEIIETCKDNMSQVMKVVGHGILKSGPNFI